LAGDDLSESAIEHAVASLVRREILERGEAPGSFRFRHALFRDAAYGLLTDEDRARSEPSVKRAAAEIAVTDPAALREKEWLSLKLGLGARPAAVHGIAVSAAGSAPAHRAVP